MGCSTAPLAAPQPAVQSGRPFRNEPRGENTRPVASLRRIAHGSGRASRVLLAFTAGLLGLAAVSLGANPGGWEHVGVGEPATSSALNGTVDALHVDGSTLLVGGAFTNAGGDPNADYVATWDGRSWKALGAPPLNGSVLAIASHGGKV